MPDSSPKDPQAASLVAMIRASPRPALRSLSKARTGTGKDGRRPDSSLREQPRRVVRSSRFNCKSLADGVVESELFGNEKGSFTGAIKDRMGCFERASGGTLVLDEDRLRPAPTFRPSCLRVLEDGEVLRVGASKTRKVNVRIVAANQPHAPQRDSSGALPRRPCIFRL